MKYTLSLIVALAFAAFTTSALAADTTTIWLTKSGDNAKVCTEKSCLGTVKVKYDDGATWATAKDSYDVSPETADSISKGGCITVHADGGISVSKPMMKAEKATAPEAKKEASKDEQKK